jgi:hypothetical protein
VKVCIFVSLWRIQKNCLCFVELAGRNKHFHYVLPHFPNTPSWRGAQLKQKENFTFTFAFICHTFKQPVANIGN